MSTPAFGLYTATGFTSAQLVAANQRFSLDRPLQRNGATVFVRSLWLPLPAVGTEMRALKATGSALAVRFEAIRFSVASSDNGWFKLARDTGSAQARFELVWPAPVLRVAASGKRDRAISLYRADGDAVSDEAAQSGQTGRDLSPPWMGSPLVIQLGEPVNEFTREERAFSAGGSRSAVLMADGGARANVAPDRAPDSAPAAMADRAVTGTMTGITTGITTGPIMGQNGIVFTLLLGSQLVPSLTLGGAPTTPRLRLLAEQAGGETLLWQSLLPGAQTSAVTLPGQDLVQAWQPALDQLLKRMRAPDAAQRPQRLRLDVESDAPCSVQLTQLQLRLVAEFELAEGAQKLAFDGVQPQPVPLSLALPSGLAAASLASATLRLIGRVSAAAQAGASGAAGIDSRRGAWVDSSQMLVLPLQLTASSRLAGVSLYWQPTSAGLRGRLRLFSDGGNGQPGRVLAEAAVNLEPVNRGWLALRWPALDLQPQRLYLEWSVAEGSGLCAFSAAGLAGAWLAQPGTSGKLPSPRLLPEPIAAGPLLATHDGDSADTRPVRLQLGTQVLSSTLPEGAFEQVVAAPTLGLLASQAIMVTGGSRGSLTLESAILSARL